MGIRSVVLALVILLGILLPACQFLDAKPATMDEVPRVTIGELRQRIESGADIVIVDTRKKAEYDKGHIAGAVSAPAAVIALGDWAPAAGKESILY